MVQYSITRLKAAIKVQRTIESFQTKIDSLTGKLTRILGNGDVPMTRAYGTGRKKMSAAGRARIAAAQKLRWAKLKGDGTGKPAGRRKMSAAAKAKIAAAARKRWAKAK